MTSVHPPSLCLIVVTCGVESSQCPPLCPTGPCATEEDVCQEIYIPGTRIGQVAPWLWAWLTWKGPGGLMGTCACCHMLPRFPLRDQTWVSMARLFRTRTSRFKEPVREKQASGMLGQAAKPACWAGSWHSSGLSLEPWL